MSERFENKVAIVTGGAQGIGGAIARMLAREKARVLIADIDFETAQENCSRISADGGIAAATCTDVAQATDVQKMVNTAVKKWGQLDILVQNAFGVGTMHEKTRGSAIEVSEESWDSGMAVLTKALYLGAKYGVPEMKKIGGGNIVNLASVHGLLMEPKALVYEAGKSAVIGMTKQMAIDFGPENIRVNSICPGHILTETLTKMWKGNEAGLKFFEDQYPLGRVGHPNDIANAVAFLCSDDAAFITGHALVVDGGLTIQLQENFGIQQARYGRNHPEVNFSFP